MNQTITPPSTHHRPSGRSSMRMSAARRPSLDLKHVFPQTDVEKQVRVHHERVFEGMVEDVLLTEKEQEEVEQSNITSPQPNDDVEVLLTDDEDDFEPAIPTSLVRRHSSYESRRRRQGMRDHDNMKELLAAAARPSKGGTATSRLEMLEHLHDISMDLSQMMKSSTTMGASILDGGDSQTETLAESCPVLSYVMEDEEDAIEMSHGRRRRPSRTSSLRRRRRKHITVIPEDEQQQEEEASQLPPQEEELHSYTVELPEDSDEENEKPRARRPHNKIASYHMLMTSMQMADDINDVTSIMESFSSLHSSSKDVMNFPSPNNMSMRKTAADSMVFKQTPHERYVASLADASSETDKPGQLAMAPAPVAMGQQPMMPRAGIARGA